MGRVQGSPLVCIYPMYISLHSQGKVAGVKVYRVMRFREWCGFSFGLKGRIKRAVFPSSCRTGKIFVIHSCYCYYSITKVMIIIMIIVVIGLITIDDDDYKEDGEEDNDNTVIVVMIIFIIIIVFIFSLLLFLF